jgi:hypothetical protein
MNDAKYIGLDVHQSNDLRGDLGRNRKVFC